MNNQTIETLKKIAAKCTLGLPLTEHEKAMWTLYGDAYTNGITPAAPEKAQTVAGRMQNEGINLSKANMVFGGGTKNCLDIEVKIEQYPDHTGFEVKIKGKVKYTDGSVQTVHSSWGDYNITAFFDNRGWAQ